LGKAYTYLRCCSGRGCGCWQRFTLPWLLIRIRNPIRMAITRAITRSLHHPLPRMPQQESSLFRPQHCACVGRPAEPPTEPSAHARRMGSAQSASCPLTVMVVEGAQAAASAPGTGIVHMASIVRALGSSAIASRPLGVGVGAAAATALLVNTV